MKYLPFYIILLYAVFFTCKCAKTSPGRIEYCVDRDTKKRYQIGEFWPAKNQCIEYLCMLQNGRPQIHVAVCPTLIVEPPCLKIEYSRIGLKNRRSFPYCCPHAYCPMRY